MDFSNIDVEKIAQVINSTDPIAVLQSIGLSSDDAYKATNGDFSVIGKDLNKPQQLDFEVIKSNYNKYFNWPLIESFFLKAKNSEQFTEEEYDIYKDVYKKWFDFIFNIGKYNTFLLDENLQSQCISIKVGEDDYGMIKNNNQYFILHHDSGEDHTLIA